MCTKCVLHPYSSTYVHYTTLSEGHSHAHYIHLPIYTWLAAVPECISVTLVRLQAHNTVHQGEAPLYRILQTEKPNSSHSQHMCYLGNVYTVYTCVQLSL